MLNIAFGLSYKVSFKIDSLLFLRIALFKKGKGIKVPYSCYTFPSLTSFAFLDRETQIHCEKYSDNVGN